MKFLKKGAAAHQEMKKADDAQQEAFEAASGPRRFWLKEGSEARITFLDGSLDKDGLLTDMVSFYEHMIPKGAFYACT